MYEDLPYIYIYASLELTLEGKNIFAYVISSQCDIRVWKFNICMLNNLSVAVLVLAAFALCLSHSNCTHSEKMSGAPLLSKNYDMLRNLRN